MLSPVIGASALHKQRASRHMIQQFVEGNVNTFGWDTVFAVRLDEVNERIRAEKSSPPCFSQTCDDYHANGEFEDWEISPSGNGTILHMNIGLRGIEIESAAGRKPLPDATAKVEVHLEFVPHNPDFLMRTGDTARYNLVIRSKPEPVLFGADGSESDPVAEITRLRFADGVQRFGDQAVLQACLGVWLNDNLDQFAHVFATVNLARQVADDAFAWVKPTYASYAFLGGEDEADSVLAVLCMSSERSAENLYETVGPGALPIDTSANFIISGERLLDDMIRKALPFAFKGLKAEDAVLAENRLSLSVDKKVKLTEVDHDGKTYDAMLHKLKIWLDGEAICMESNTETEVSPGIFSICRASYRYLIKLVNNRAGQQTLAYEQIGEPAVDHTTRHSKGIKILQWVLYAIAAIGIAIVIFMTAGMALLVAAPIIILCAGALGLMTQIPKMIEAIKHDDAPPLDLLIANATAPIRWAGAGLFKLRNVVFSDSLVLSGDFVAAN